jgi:fructose-bisphosphate aldolase, class II
MPLTPVQDLLATARSNGYAIGYFESWDLDSLLSIASAAETCHSPVLLGFSGIYLHHPERITPAPLEVYATMGLAVCQSLSVPCNLVFNESPHFDQVLAATQSGFGLVMFSDDQLAFEEQVEQVRKVVAFAHPIGVAVEGEASPLPGVGGELSSLPQDLRLTDPYRGCQFIARTGVDALAVNIGQAHLHGRRQVRLDLDRLAALKHAISIPMVLHGASSVHPTDLQAVIRLGICKINLGSRLKRVYFEALRQACLQTLPIPASESKQTHCDLSAPSAQSPLPDDQREYNPYLVIGSGLQEDIQVSAHLALRQEVEHWMALFGSAGKA